MDKRAFLIVFLLAVFPITLACSENNSGNSNIDTDTDSHADSDSDADADSDADSDTDTEIEIDPATTVFVDNLLPTNITDGSYSITNRDATGTDGNAYTTVAGGVAALGTANMVLIRHGTYLESGISIGHSGTEIQPKVIRNYPNEHVHINGEQPNESEIPVLEINRSHDNQPISYITIQGLEISGGGGHETANIDVGNDYEASNIVIQNCILYHDGSGAGAHNPAIVRFNHTTNCTIQNNTIYSDGAGNNDRGGIKFWAPTTHLTIRNNEVYGVDRKGIDNKHGGSYAYHIIENNYVHDCGSNGIHLNGDHSIVRNNLVVNCGLTYDDGAMMVYYEAGGPGGSNSIIEHNTFASSNKGLVLGNAGTSVLTDCTVRNNVFYNNYQAGHPNIAISPYGTAPYDHNHILDYNCYFETDESAIGRYLDDTAYDLASWQTTLGQETNSIQADPVFSNESGSFSHIGDFQVGSDSPAKGGSDDGTDMGANITLVGIQ